MKENNRLQDLEKTSFAQEIEGDKKVVQKYLQSVSNAAYEQDTTYQNDLEKFRNPDKSQAAAQTPLTDDQKTSIQNKLSADVFKRTMILLGSSDLKVKNGDQTKDASENNLPLASYLSHGARTLVEIPAGTNNELINWLTSGNKDVDGKSTSYTQNDAINENKIVFARRAATHDVEIKDGKLTELKGFGIGLKDAISSPFKATNHFGVNLNLDPHGDAKAAPDGNHGHLYIHYKAPTENQPGSLLVGLESSEPASPNHSKTGASDPMSPVGSSKWDDLRVKKGVAGENEYKDTLIPQKYNGVFIKLDQDKLNSLTSLDHKTVDKLGSDIGSKIPAKSMEEFKSANVHQTPEMKPTKDITEPVKPKFYALKKLPIINLFFKKEIKEYKEAKKNYKIQNKVVEAAKEVNNSSVAPQHQVNKEQSVITQQVQHEVQSIVGSAAGTQVTQDELNKSKSQQTSSTKGQSVS